MVCISGLLTLSIVVYTKKIYQIHCFLVSIIGYSYQRRREINLWKLGDRCVYIQFCFFYKVINQMIESPEILSMITSIYLNLNLEQNDLLLFPTQMKTTLLWKQTNVFLEMLINLRII